MNEERRLPSTIVVGRVRKPHGVRGEISIEILSDVPDRFAAGGRLLLRCPEARPRPVEVISSRPHGEAQVIRLTGCRTREDAETLRGALLEVERAQVPSAPDGSYYHYQLIGCACIDRTSGALGPVVDVIEDGGGWLLEIGHSNGRLLVPFVEAFLVDVDVEGGRIEIDVPAELIELCASTS